MGKGKKHRRQSFSKKALPPLEVIVVPKIPKKKYQIYGVAVWKYITGFILITGAIPVYFFIKNELRSTHEKYESENFIQGDLAPLKLTKEQDMDTLNKESNLVYNSSLILDSVDPSAPELKGILISDMKGHSFFKQHCYFTK